MDLLHVIAYDHRNPVRVGMVVRAEDYAGSSAATWRTGESDRILPRVPVDLPFGVDSEEFRLQLLEYQDSHRPDDVAEALAKYEGRAGDPGWLAILWAAFD